MRVISCEVRDVDHCVDRQDHRRGRHLDVGHQRRVRLHQVHHLDVGHRNLDERRVHLVVHHLDHRGDLLVRAERRDLDAFLGRDGYLDLVERQGLDGSQMGQRDVIRERCADLEEAVWGDLTPTSGQAAEEWGDHRGEHQEASRAAFLEEFHLDDLVVVQDVALAAD